MNLESLEFKEVKLSMGTLRDMAAQQLHAFKAVPDNYEVVSVDFGEITTDTEGRELVSIKYGVEKRKAVLKTENEAT